MTPELERELQVHRLVNEARQRETRASAGVALLLLGLDVNGKPIQNSGGAASSQPLAPATLSSPSIPSIRSLESPQPAKVVPDAIPDDAPVDWGSAPKTAAQKAADLNALSLALAAKRKAAEAAAALEPKPAPAPVVELPPEPAPWNPDYVAPGDWDAAAKSFHKDNDRTLAFYHGNFWQWNDHEYVHRDRSVIERNMAEFLRDGITSGARTFKVSRGTVREVTTALEQVTALPVGKLAPFWRPRLDGGAPLDARPASEFIALKNCLVHAPTGDTVELTPEFFTRNTLQFNYDPEAECARWNGCLTEWFDDPNDRLRLQEFCGYFLTRWTSLQKFFILLGTGGNGKLVVVRVLTRLLGMFNAEHINMKDLTREKTRALFVEALVAIVGEFSFARKSDRLAVTDFIKEVTGEDFDGRYGARLLVSANRVPSFIDDSQGLGRRAEGIMFTREFDDDTRDVDLIGKLYAELPGIFNWALEGHQRLYKAKKFTASKSSAELRHKIVRAAGGVASFMTECCDLVPDGFVAFDDLRAAYDAWHGPKIGPNEFNDAVELVHPGALTRGRPWGGGVNRPRGFIGLKLKAEWS
jgi:P4 family phage/plasmid primase-like protien